MNAQALCRPAIFDSASAQNSEHLRQSTTKHVPVYVCPVTYKIPCGSLIACELLHSQEHLRLLQCTLLPALQLVHDGSIAAACFRSPSFAAGWKRQHCCCFPTNPVNSNIQKQPQTGRQIALYTAVHSAVLHVQESCRTLTTITPGDPGAICKDISSKISKASAQP